MTPTLPHVLIRRLGVRGLAALDRVAADHVAGSVRPQEHKLVAVLGLKRLLFGARPARCPLQLGEVVFDLRDRPGPDLRGALLHRGHEA